MLLTSRSSAQSQATTIQGFHHDELLSYAYWELLSTNALANDRSGRVWNTLRSATFSLTGQQCDFTLRDRIDR